MPWKKWKKWKEGQDVNFDNIDYELDNYKMDEHIYNEIPARVGEEVASTEKGLHFLTIAVQKSSKLLIRQSIRTADSVKRFSCKSTFLSMVMIVLVVCQIILGIVMIIK